MAGETADGRDDAYSLELYKNLRREAADYLEKIPALWLQKFLFAGAVLGFVVTTPAADLPNLVGKSGDFVIAAFICVPVLALLLNIKIFEYSLHARAISRFIEREFQDVPKVTAWEAALWGGGPHSEVTNLTRYRSAATVAVTLVSTAVLIVLSGIVVGTLSRQMTVALSIATAAAAIYVGAGVWSAFVIWPRFGLQK